MYIPKNLQMTASSVNQFIHEYGFGCLVSANLTCSHLPFLFDEKYNVLYTHLAKANTHWQGLAGKEVLIIFSGPHAYISPTWYDKGPAVPTWNYAAVHVIGTVSLLSETETLNVVNQTVEKYEPSLFSELGIFSEQLNAKLAKAIVGLKIDITNIEGKQKLGQQRTQADQLGVFQALQQGDLEAQLLAEYMKKHEIGLG
ncbi:transcriptional regulator [Pseudoalteromonas phenolica]|uniref:Transcriptional regulator n=1 Tax=Pseudoalteromonas phenolica TaxID=161398 RepID=A0A5R9Q431_9GAMM|nr:FMN-binding negative transcriptional regulator [Pseudoalteromonas phenolica]TLX47009.1 transcriptional regulator [Pseudoalteromonas phenolica]